MQAQSLPSLVCRRVRSQVVMRTAPFGARAALVSYPKSGRTWLRFLLANFLATTHDLSPNVDLANMFALIPNYAGDNQRGVGAWRREGRREGVPLILVSHLSYSRARFLRLPILFMVRNPYDVMVSSYFHSTRHRQNYSGDVSDFLRDRGFGLQRYIDFHNGWARGLSGHRALVLSYEGLAADPFGTAASAVTFLGLKSDDPALTRAVEASSFERMRAIEREVPIPDHTYDVADQDSLRVRRGQVGGYQEVLNADDIAWIDATCRLRLDAPALQLLRGTGWAVAANADASCRTAGGSPPPAVKPSDGTPGTAR